MVVLSSIYFRKCPSDIQLRNPMPEKYDIFAFLKVQKVF